MCRGSATTYGLILALVLLAGSEVQAERKRLKKPSERSFEIRQTRLCLVPNVQLGYLHGGAAREIEFWSSDPTKLLTYGVSVSMEYALTDHWALEGSIERSRKGLPVDSLGAILGWSYGAGCLYRWAPYSKVSPYARVHGGRITVQLDEIDLGAHTFYRFGFGLRQYTASTLSVRLELFYRRILSDGYVLPGESEREVDYDVAYLGLEIGLGVGL